MASKQKQTEATPVDLAFGETEYISADDLTDLITEVTGRAYDPKTIRQRLRKTAARNQEELKGARWKIDRTLAEREIDHYTARNSKSA